MGVGISGGQRVDGGCWGWRGVRVSGEQTVDGGRWCHGRDRGQGLRGTEVPYGKVERSGADSGDGCTTA